MAPKKVRMSLADFNDMHGGDMKAQKLPDKSTGLEFGGKAFGPKGGYGSYRDRDEDRGFGGKSKGKKGEERSRADHGDWFAKDRRDNFRDSAPTRSDQDGEWRGGGGRASTFGDRSGKDEGGKGMRRGNFGGDDNRDWRRGGGDAERPRLSLKPRTVDGPPGGVAQSIREQMGSGGGDRPRAGGATKSYVPPCMRKQQEERERKEKEIESERKKKSAEEDRRRQEQEVAEAEEQRKEQEKRRQAEAKRAQELQEKKQRKKAKDAEKRRAKELAGLEQSDDEPDHDVLRHQKFEKKVKAAVSGKGDTKKLAKEITSVLEPEDLQKALPARHLFRPILAACREKTDEFVLDLVKRFTPVVEKLIIEGEDTWRYKMKFIAEVAAAALEIRLPRLSPKSGLLEVIFDGLYQTELIEEQYFKFWSRWEDDKTLGKNKAVFQVQPFLEFLDAGRVQGEDDDDVEFKVMEGTFAYGDDLEEAVMTIEQARRRAIDLGDICKGFVFEGEPSDDMFEVVFMSREGWEITNEDSEEYTTVMKVTDDNEDSEADSDN